MPRCLNETWVGTPECGKARQEVVISVAWYPYVHRPKFSKILGHRFGKCEPARPIARRLSTDHLGRKSPPEDFPRRVVGSHTSLLFRHNSPVTTASMSCSTKDTRKARAGYSSRIGGGEIGLGARK